MTSTFDNQLPPSQVGPQNGAPEHILLVEDDQQLLHVLTLLLRESGHQVFATPDPDMALRYGVEQDVTLMIVDVHLAGRNGLELMRHVAQHKPNLPGLVITGNPSVETAVEALRLRVVDYIVKPFEPEALRRQIDKLRAERARLESLDSFNNDPHSVSQPAPGHELQANAAVPGTGEAAVPNQAKLAEAKRLVDALSELLERPAGQEGEANPAAGGDAPQARSAASGSGPLPAAGEQWELDASLYPSLSPRERQIVEGLIRHGSIEHLSKELEISPYTARNHLRSIYRKLGVRSQVELVLMVTRGARPNETQTGEG